MNLLLLLNAIASSEPHSMLIGLVDFTNEIAAMPPEIRNENFFQFVILLPNKQKIFIRIAIRSVL